MTEVESFEAQEIACRLVGLSQALAMEAGRGGDHSALLAMVSDDLHELACRLGELADGLRP